MTTLYDIAADYRAAVEAIDPETGEVSDDLEARLDAIGGELSAKVSAVACYRANVLAEAAAYKAEAARLTDRKRAAEAKAARLRAYLGTCLGVMGVRKVATPTHTVSLQQTSGKIVLDVAVRELGPAWTVTQDPKPDLAGIKAALKSGDEDAAKVAHIEAGDSVQVR